MGFKVNLSVFRNEHIREALGIIQQVGSRRKLGIKRWDNLLDMYPFSGTVVVPVKFCGRVFREPFYFVIEKVNEKESIRVKPVKGEQWSIGDVYGFFGFYDFEDYVYDMPILIVEGHSDWAVCKRYYKYTVTSMTAWLSKRQAFFLSGLTKNIFIGYDSDETGITNGNKNKELLKKLGCNVVRQIPPQKDWGHLFESDFGQMLLDRSMNNFLSKVNQISKYLV